MSLIWHFHSNKKETKFFIEFFEGGDFPERDQNRIEENFDVFGDDGIIFLFKLVKKLHFGEDLRYFPIGLSVIF